MSARAWFVSCVCLLASAVYAQAETPILPKESLRIECVEQPKLNGEYIVSSDGTVILPYLGIVELGGLDSIRATARLEALLKAERIVEAPTVSVVRPGLKPAVPEVKAPVPPEAAAAARASVGGAVSNPSTFLVTESTTLSAVLAAARPNASAELGSVLVRSADGRSMSYDCSKYVPVVFIEDGDSVTIPTRQAAPSVTVLGPVRTPGAIEWRQGMTVRAALEAAGMLQDGVVVERVDVSTAVGRTGLGWPDEAEPYVLPAGSTVTVIGTTTVGQVRVIGAVRNPGYFVANGRLTLMKAVRSAGGTLDKADAKRVVVRRAGETRKTYVDLTKIEQGLLGDLLLNVGDVVEVPGGRSRRYTPGAAAGFVGLAWFVLGR